MFRWQHGPHRQGLGALFSKLVEPHFRWNSRAEAFLATGIVVAAALCAIYLKTRAWGPISLSDVAIPLIFFAPAQYESLWITPNFAQGPLPLLLVILYCLALTCQRVVLRYTLALTVNFLAIYTGYGWFIGVITPLWLLLEYYSRRKAGEPSNFVFIPFAVSLLSLGSFFTGYVFAPAADCFSLQPRAPSDYLVFVALMLAHFFGARGSRFFVSIPLGSAILAAMILVVVIFARRWKKTKNCTCNDLISAVLVGYCLLYCVTNAYARTCLGRETAFSSGYVEYVGLGILGLYFTARSLRMAWTRRIFSGLLVAILLGPSLRVPPKEQYVMQLFHDFKANWRSCYLKTESIQECDRVAGFGVYPQPEQTHLKEKLEFLKRTRQNLYYDLRR